MLDFRLGAKRALPTRRAFPKRKSPSIPSICVASWQCSPRPQAKIKHRGLDSHPFCIVFSGTARVWRLVQVCILYFSQNFTRSF